jgi:hypothetical protein
MSAPLQLPAEPPPAVRRALEVRDARARDVASVRQGLHAARTAAEAAVAQDRAAYVAARDRGKPDPGPATEQAARARLADLERRKAGEMVRLATAEDNLSAAVAEHVDAWTQSVAKTWARADAASRRAIEKFQETEEQRRAIRMAAAWLAQVQESGSLDSRVRPVSDETSLADARSADAQGTPLN